MKRALIITYYWPPSGGSGVQRWVKFAKYLPQEGWESVVYAPSNAQYPVLDKSMGKDLPQGLEVLRRPIFEPYGIYRRIMGKGQSAEISKLVGNADMAPRKKTFKERLSLWIRANLFVPDPRAAWVKPSVRFLKEYLKEHPVDIIITTGPPHSVHLIGERLKKELGTPWIPDFRDPWTGMYYMKHLPFTKRNRERIARMEKGVLDSASTILTATPSMQEDFRVLTATPVEAITNGYDREDFAAEIPTPDGCFNIVHTGLFAGNPIALWDTLAAMSRDVPGFASALKLRLVGKVDPAVEAAIKERGLQAVYSGYLDHAAAVKEQRLASVLILPLKKDPQYKSILPGKLFEYLASRRPVLAISFTDGAMAPVIRECNGGETVDWEDRAAMRAFLEKAWKQHLEGGVPPCTGNIEKYSREALTHSLSLLLSKTAK